MEGDPVLLLPEGEVDLDDFNDVMEMSLSLFSTDILESLTSLMTSISESEKSEPLNFLSNSFFSHEINNE